MQLEHRVALITGAGRGIGRDIALAYAKEGARLALTARTLSELEETAHQAQAGGAETLIICTDVSDPGQVHELVQRTLDRFSTIDILVNNAAVLGPVGSLEQTDIPQWIHAIQVNLIGTYLCCHAVLPVMLRQDRGKIINMSSAMVVRPHVSAYTASKSAINRLTESLAIGLIGKNIQVNAMIPNHAVTRIAEELRDGYKHVGDTEQFQWVDGVIRAGGGPIEQTTGLAVFLASDASGNLSGRTILALTDDFHNLPSRIADIMASGTYTWRRVEPK